MQTLINFELPQMLLKGILTAAALLGIILVCVLLVAAVLRLLRVRGAREHAILLTNQGNARSIYHLTAESQQPLLNFRFFMNKIPLAEVPPPAPVPPPPQPAAVEQSMPQANAPVPAAGKSAPPATSSAGGAVKGAKKAGQGVAKKTGALASLLGAVGGLLPGKVGQQLKAGGSQAREMQTKATQAMDAPDQMERRMDAVQKSGGQLGAKAPAGSSPASGGRSAGPTTASRPAVSYSTQAGSQMSQQTALQTAAPAIPYVYTVQTREVPPGETISLVLRIGSKKRRFPEGTHVYTITSEQVPLDKLNRTPPPHSKQGSVHFKHIGEWRYWLPPILSSIVVISALLAAISTIALIWL